MPAKRKKSHDPKQAADPLGKIIFFSHHIAVSVKIHFLCSR